MAVIAHPVQHSWLYSAANAYKNIVGGTASVAYHSTKAVASCVRATFSTIEESHRLGAIGTARTIRNSIFGINDLRRAVAVFPKHDQIFTEAGRPNVHLIRPDTRDFAQRLGESSAHVLNGAAKAISATVVGSAYITGTVSNAFGTPLTGDLSNFFNASKLLASGINNFGYVAIKTSCYCAMQLGSLAKTVATPILTHPVLSTQIAFNVGAVGAGLYVACDQGVKAANSQSFFGKVGHGMLATAGVVSAVILPIALNTSMFAQGTPTSL
jgi:hypothetical protein